MTTGQLIREARKKAGMTQAELAKKLGISYVGISQWENGTRNPKYDTLQRIASALEIDWTELVPEGERAQTIIKHIKDGLSDGKSFKKMTQSDAYNTGILKFNSEKDRIIYFYNCLNMDGMLTASIFFIEHLKSEDTAAVADYVQSLSTIPQYQKYDDTPSKPQTEPAEGVNNG